MVHDNLKLPSNRNFGVTFIVVFLIVGALPLFNHGTVHWWAWIISAIFGVVTLLKPQWLRLLNVLWARFGLLLHHMVSPIALAILFYLVVTPTGLVMRLLGKDMLKLRIERDVKTYWISRTPSGPDAKSFNNQF